MTHSTVLGETGTSSRQEDSGWTVVHRTIVRPDLELDVRPLYITGVSAFSAEDSTGQSGASPESDDSEQKSSTKQPSRATAKAAQATIGDDGSTTVENSERVSFGTYFNAFPASYWRRWTDFESVRLRARLRGRGTFTVYRSTSKGHVLRAESFVIDDDHSSTDVEVELSLKPFIDGGWYWFDIEAADARLTLQEACWEVQAPPPSGTVTIGITTFNRPDFCVAQLANLAASPDVMEIVDELIVVDQGTDKVVDDPDYAAAAEALGSKLRIIEQPNLGGSGGFSRAMAETVGAGVSDYVLLLDDDVVCELEGIKRAVVFADLTKTPTIVGGHMFSLYARSVLHAFGETLARYRWFWGPAPDTVRGHDFSQKSLRSTKWLHRRVDVDYNGWWMCLIPTRAIREIGLSLPMFIKWDDAEFGVRAQEAGYPTVSLPGVAVWHVPWTEKDDTVDWQAYFHERNRLISGLLHSPYPRGGRLIRESFETHAKHTVSMQYGPAEMILMAISDVLDGPERMHRDMTQRLGELRELRKGFADSQSRSSLDEFPAPGRAKPPRKGRTVLTPTGPVGRVRTAAVGLLKQFRPVRPMSTERPETIIPHAVQRWWRFMQFDSALVSSADGTSVSWYRRDPEEFRNQLVRSAQLHARLYQEWPALAERYRQALPELTSPDLWQRTFEGQPAGN